MILQQFNPECRPFPVEMRLKVKNGSIIVVFDDSYSSDFNPKIALDFRKSKAFSKKTVILSDILSTEELYSKVAQLVVSNKISRVIGIEKLFRSLKTSLSIALLSKLQLIL
jgi:alanine racemase